MTYTYVVTLKNQQTRSLDALGFLLSIVSVFFFVYEMLASQEIGLAYLLGSAFIIGVVAWNVYMSFRKNRKVYYSRALLIAALVWMKMPFFQWLSFAFIILALLEYQAKYSIEIGFTSSQIVINTLIKKHYTWADLNNVVLKDGLLTLDFANNRVMQKEVEDDEDDDADEDEFNEWCRAQLPMTNGR